MKLLLPKTTWERHGSSHHSPVKAKSEWRSAIGNQSPSPFIPHPSSLIEALPENDRTRYTITPAARKDLLTRLLKLNHQRAAEEAAAQPPPTKGSKPKKAQRAKQEDELL
jgi:hypothetical protein